MLLVAAFENLELGLPRLVALGPLVDVVGANELLEGLHDHAALEVVKGQGGEGIDCCSL